MNNKEIINNWFVNKDQYLAWRLAWRAEYQALSKKIKEEKRERKNSDPALRSMAQWHCHQFRQEATALLELRKKSKVEAQRQYLALKIAEAETRQALGR